MSKDEVNSGLDNNGIIEGSQSDNKPNVHNTVDSDLMLDGNESNREAILNYDSSEENKLPSRTSESDRSDQPVNGQGDRDLSDSDRPLTTQEGTDSVETGARGDNGIAGDTLDSSDTTKPPTGDGDTSETGADTQVLSEDKEDLNEQRSESISGGNLLSVDSNRSGDDNGKEDSKEGIRKKAQESTIDSGNPKETVENTDEHNTDISKKRTDADNGARYEKTNEGNSQDDSDVNTRTNNNSSSNEDSNGNEDKYEDDFEDTELEEDNRRADENKENTEILEDCKEKTNDNIEYTEKSDSKEDIDTSDKNDTKASETKEAPEAKKEITETGENGADRDISVNKEDIAINESKRKIETCDTKENAETSKNAENTVVNVDKADSSTSEYKGNTGENNGIKVDEKIRTVHKDFVESEDNLQKLEQDLEQAKEDSENSVSESKEKAANSSDLTQEPEGEVTKVVVDDDGIPKVLVTTVPDRPPSSQASDDERENPEDESDSAQYKKDATCVSEQDTYANSKETDYKNDANGQKTDNAEQKTGDINGGSTVEPSEIEEQIAQEKNKETTEEDGLNSHDDSSEVKSNGKPKFLSESEVQESCVSETNTMESEEKGNTCTSDNRPSDTKEDNDANPENSKVEAQPGDTEAKDSVQEDTSTVKSPVESPLEKLLKRNVEIDGTAELITQLEQNVVTLLSSMKEVMSHYSERLKLQTLKDMTEDIGKFRGDFQSVNEACQSYSSMTTNLNQKLKELRHVTEDVKTQISRKFMSEDLSTWVDITPEQEKGMNII